MLAPNQVTTPAATQTSSMPAKLGTARLTSDGWTKIDEPTMVLTTIGVACVSPIERVSRVDTGWQCYTYGGRILYPTRCPASYPTRIGPHVRRRVRPCVRPRLPIANASTEPSRWCRLRTRPCQTDSASHARTAAPHPPDTAGSL